MTKIDSENCTGCKVADGLTQALNDLNIAITGLNKWRWTLSGAITIIVFLFSIYISPAITRMSDNITRISNNQIAMKADQVNMKTQMSDDKKSVQNSIYTIKDKIIAEINKQK